MEFDTVEMVFVLGAAMLKRERVTIGQLIKLFPRKIGRKKTERIMRDLITMGIVSKQEYMHRPNARGIRYFYEPSVAAHYAIQALRDIHHQTASKYPYVLPTWCIPLPDYLPF